MNKFIEVKVKQRGSCPEYNRSINVNHITDFRPHDFTSNSETTVFTKDDGVYTIKESYKQFRVRIASF